MRKKDGEKGTTELRKKVRKGRKKKTRLTSKKTGKKEERVVLKMTTP